MGFSLEYMGAILFPVPRQAIPEDDLRKRLLQLCDGSFRKYLSSITIQNLFISCQVAHNRSLVKLYTRLCLTCFWTDQARAWTGAESKYLIVLVSPL